MTKISKTKFFRDPQNIIAIGITVISLCALMVSLIQTSLLNEERELLREYSRASVWPNLEITLGKSHDKNDGSINQFGISITNSGVGPAIITDVKVSCNDSIAKNWWHLFEIMEVPDSIEKYISNKGFNGRVIKIGETLETLFERMQEKKFSIEIYYESIYGEKWKNFNGTISKLENFEGLPDEEQFH